MNPPPSLPLSSPPSHHRVVVTDELWHSGAARAPHETLDDRALTPDATRKKSQHKQETLPRTPAPSPLPPSLIARTREEGSCVHRVSSPWLKLLSAVGVILLVLITMMKRRRSSAQRSGSDNQLLLAQLLTRCTPASPE